MVLLVVDTQKLIFNDKLYMFDAITHNIKQLLDTARKNRIEVIYVRHDDGAAQELTKGNDGFEIYKEFVPMNKEKIFDKTVNSAFNGTGLLEYLTSINEKQIIVTGLQTEYCIDATVKCGFEHGLQIIVPEYTNSTFNNSYLSAEKSYRYYNEFIWKDRYAKCISLKDTFDLMKQPNPHLL